MQWRGSTRPTGNWTGDPDETFHFNGRRIIEFLEGTNEEATAVAIDANGRLVAAGSLSIPDRFALARLKPDGTLDGDFGKAGKVTIDNFLGTFHQETSALVIDANGKLVVAGRVADELPD